MQQHHAGKKNKRKKKTTNRLWSEQIAEWTVYVTFHFQVQQNIGAATIKQSGNWEDKHFFHFFHFCLPIVQVE